MFSALSQIAGKALTLVWVIVAARLLDAGDFGVFFYALAVATLVTTVAEWGFDAVLVREASREPSRLGALTGAALRLELAVALPALVIGCLFTVLGQEGGENRAAVILVFSGALLEVLSDTCRATSQAAQRQGGTATALVAQRFVTAAMIVVALVLGFDLVGLCVGFFLGTAVGVVGHGWAMRRLELNLHEGWRRELRPLIATSWFVGASAIALIALSKIDTVLLQVLRDSREVGLYAATYRLLDTTLFFVFALSSGIFPAIAASGESRAASRGVSSGVAAAAFIYAPFAAVCLVDAGPVLRLVFGSQFAGAAPALAWLALAALPYAIAYLGNGALQALDLSRWLLITALGAVVLNVSVNVALIPHFGATGAGAATTLAYVAEAAAVLVVLRRCRGVRVAVLAGAVLPVLGAALSAGVLVLLRWPVLLEVAAAAITYLAVTPLLMRRLRPDDLAFLTALRPQRGRVTAERATAAAATDG